MLPTHPQEMYSSPFFLQRQDGNIPFAIFPGATRSDGKWLRGLRNPEDVFTFEPPRRPGAVESSEQTRPWVGLFEHWQSRANPLGVLGPVCYLLTAAEINDHTGSPTWLRDRLASLKAAAQHVSDRTSDNGLIAGSGFYMEMPPRFGWDGITQCYVVHAWRAVAWLCGAAGDGDGQMKWEHQADRLQQQFSHANLRMSERKTGDFVLRFAFELGPTATA